MYSVPLFVCQDGTESDDTFTSAVVGEDGLAILSGTSDGDWGGISKGDTDFAAIQIDRDGGELWRWQVRPLPSGHPYSYKPTLLQNVHYHLDFETFTGTNIYICCKVRCCCKTIVHIHGVLSWSVGTIVRSPDMCSLCLCLMSGLHVKVRYLNAFDQFRQ